MPSLLLLGGALGVYRGYVVLAAQRGRRFSPTARHLATFSREAVARAVLSVIGVMAIGKAPLPGLASVDRPAVVLVPGGWNRSSMWFLAAFLRRRGHVVAVTDRAHHDSTLAEDAASLQETVRQVLDRTRASTVHLVGFDRGGLVAAWYARHLEGAERVGVLVTLGTPWRGTRTSMFRRGAEELRWDNPVLDDLAPPQVPTVCVWSPDDPEVVPTASAVPTDGVQGVCLEGAGHSELLLSARAFLAVESALRGALQAPV
ncbi:MAG: pimeloyl-ACP methyl ester carboxylesterase [Myxococcota bacterium]